VYVEAARALRLSLVEVIMRRMDQVAREQERARVRQEALTAELDRRLGELDIEAGRRAVAEAELSQVLRQTVTDQEAERERIARELHDSLGQALTLLQLGLDGLGHSVSANAEAQAQVLALKRLTHGVGKEINRLAWEIRPTALGDLGLRTAVRQLVETWSERSQLQFDLHVAPDDRRLDTAVETTLYRVLQEAITNVVRHAEASRVDVILETNDQEARLIVEDDGRGFAWNDAAPAIGPTKRLGLLGIRERLQLVGGTLEIESAPGRGTTLFIRVPL
jgi:signal transduction histidine kinase